MYASHSKKQGKKQKKHGILLVENCEARDGEQKVYFTNIESAWLKDSGAISCEMFDDPSVSGRFVTLVKKENE